MASPTTDEDAAVPPEHSTDARATGQDEVTYHNDPDAVYNLPNDNEEHRRLNTQDGILSRLMNNKVLVAPIDRATPGLMLDIGCGTGSVTRLMAETYPKATSIGLDLSPVPNAATKPPNARFFQGNVTTQTCSQWRAADEGPALGPDHGAFVYAFSRLILLGMSDWDGHVRRRFDLLQPGGWAEFHEPNWEYRDGGGRVVSDDWEWLAFCRRVCEGRDGMDFRAGSRAGERLREAGFEEVRTVQYKWSFRDDGPAGTTTTEEEREVGRFMATIQPNMFHRLIERLVLEEMPPGQEASDLIDRYRSEMWETLAPREAMYMPFYVTIGRRPLARG